MMRINRWMVAGCGLAIVLGLVGCSESNKLTLAEMERLKRDTDKQMRLVREQNEQINTKLNLIKAKMDTIELVYIPAVNTKLDSVALRPEQAKVQMINEVENRLKTITDNVREFKNEVNSDMAASGKALTDTISTRLSSFNARVTHAERYVEFVLAKQDSVNREFAVRIDKRPWYRSIIGEWVDQERGKHTP